MKEDFSGSNKPKEDIRSGNISAAKKMFKLWDHSLNSLNCDWAELAGRNAPTFKLLLEENAIANNKFIGIDINSSVIKECIDVFSDSKDNAVWIEESMENIISYKPGQLDNVGVLVFDSFNNFIGEPIKRELNLISDFAIKQYNKFGEFLLIVNVSKRGRNSDIENYCKMVSDSLGGIPIYKDNVEEYRSEGKRVSMLNLRILLQ